MLDTRTEIRDLLGRMEFSSGIALLKISICVLIASVLAFWPGHDGLTDAGRWALFILLLAAGLWISEAIAAFAVALLVIALQIAILGRPGGVLATEPQDWEIFIRPWSSPVLWLFFGGFILASAAQKTELDRWIARRVLAWCGSRPDRVLLGVMATTFVFSMFISNTATAAMMMAVIAPVVASSTAGDAYTKGLVLTVPVAANLGGMGTIIGSPPNAIAAGMLTATRPVDFTTWMVAGIPPALLLLGTLWLYFRWRYPSSHASFDLSALEERDESRALPPRWQRWLVIGVFLATISLWMTTALHEIPSPVVSFLPIVAFAVSGVLEVEDVRKLHWDVLLMLAGGLSLGVGVVETGLAQWIVGGLPAGMGILALALALAYLTWLVSNFMSNTAAANILVPLGLTMGAGFEPLAVVPMALAASASMCLPVSTPPNAIAYATGKINSADLLKIGLLVGILAPLLVVLWCFIVFR